MNSRLQQILIRLIGRETGREARLAVNHARRAIAATLTRGEHAPVPVADIRDGLSRGGVNRGDTLLLHSGIGTLARAGRNPVRSFKPAEYAHEIIDAIIDLLGPAGTLAVPTAPVMLGSEMANRKVVFDPSVDPTGTGLIPNLVLAHRGRSRSMMPWQNISALGGAAKEITADHLQSSPFAMGAGSPWGKLVDRRAKVALLGVDHDRSSTVHILEHMMAGTYPRPVFFDKPHRFRIRAEDNLIIEADAYLHAVSWHDDDINRFCRYVDGSHQLYNRVPLGRTSVQVFGIHDQLNAFRSEIENGISMYDPQFK